MLSIWIGNALHSTFEYTNPVYMYLIPFYHSLIWLKERHQLANLNTLPKSISQPKLSLVEFVTWVTCWIRDWEQKGLSGPISAVSPRLQCGQGWGNNFSRGQPLQDNNVSSGVVFSNGTVLPMPANLKLCVSFVATIFSCTDGLALSLWWSY